MIIVLQGGLRDGERFEVEFPTPTVVAPGALEDVVRRWEEDHFVYAFPMEVYKVSSVDRAVYVYDHTKPPCDCACCTRISPNPVPVPDPSSLPHVTPSGENKTGSGAGEGQAS